VPGAEILGERDGETDTRGEAETDWLAVIDAMDAVGIQVAERLNDVSLDIDAVGDGSTD
jgi:hypothetical protein